MLPLLEAIDRFRGLAARGWKHAFHHAEMKDALAAEASLAWAKDQAARIENMARAIEVARQIKGGGTVGIDDVRKVMDAAQGPRRGAQRLAAKAGDDERTHAMDEETAGELDARINASVRNVTVSRMFEKGKVYDLLTHEEDPDGTLAPTHSHCWLRWESKHVGEDGTSELWMPEALEFGTLEEAEEAKAYLEKHIV